MESLWDLVTLKRGSEPLGEDHSLNFFLREPVSLEQKLKVTRKIRRESELYIPIPESDIEPINVDNSEQFLKEMAGGETDEKQEFEVEINSDTEDLFKYLKQDLPCLQRSRLENVDETSTLLLPKEQQGGKPKSILKKKVQISTTDDRVLLNTDNEPIVNKKESIGHSQSVLGHARDKLKLKLETMWADQVKNLGIKPGKNKKTLSKTDITKKILNNPKLHDKALKAIRKIEIVKSDTASES